MAQLIQMRQRIRTIETIKKVTHAMRLIAMSSHGRLKHKQETLRNYCNEIDSLFARVRAQTPSWQSALLHPSPGHHQLAILVSSQKGLCGNFNSIIFDFFKKNNNMLQLPSIIAVGKKAADFIDAHCGVQPVLVITELTARNYLMIGKQIIDFLKSISVPYSSVTVYSNFAKTFFTQLPHATQLVPVNESTPERTSYTESAVFEQPVEEILNDLSEHYLTAHLQYILFESLLSEQAARFISMDNSTRNANTLLETTKLQYNKLRQAKITKELIELSSSLT